MSAGGPQSLQPGERVPDFFAQCQTGEYVSLYDRALGGALVVIVTARLRSPAGERCLRDACARLGDGADPRVHLVAITRDAQPEAGAVAAGLGFPGCIFCDENGQAAGALRCDWTALGDGTRVIALDANLRVVGSFDAVAGDAVEAAAGALRALPAPAAHEVAHTAPALFVPRVLEPGFCQRLMDAFHAQGHEEGGVYSVQQGTLVHAVDGSIKKRQDHALRDPELAGAVAERFMRRLLPEIQKAFHYRVTAAEEYKVVRYRGEEGGFFGAHRDDRSPQTAHRRFAITLNLNDGYEGGHLRFPEYGPHLYRPAAGEAIVFSCSLLHQVAPVTRGHRFVLLAFLYGEDGKQERREIEAMMARQGQRTRR